MSWQPMMQIPRNRRLSGRTWLVAVLAPLVGLLVAYLIALISLLVAPSAQEIMSLSDGALEGAPTTPDVTDWIEGAPSTALSALILLVMGLIAPIRATVSVITEFGFPIPIQISLVAIPLTLTVTVAVVIFFMHRRSCRRISQSPLLLWLPALISAGVLAGAALILAQFTKTRIIFTPPAEAGITEIHGVNMTSELDLAWLALAALAIGLLASFLGRLNAIPARRAAYASTSVPNLTPSIAHGLRVSFGVLVLSVLSTGVYMTIYALVKMEEDVPLRIVFYVLPYLVNLGVVTTLSSLGGLGVMTMRAPSQITTQDPTGLSDYERVREQIFQGAPWTVWIMAVLVVLAVVIGGIHWARTRDPRRERGLVSWLILPLSFTLFGAAAIAANMLVFFGSAIGEEVDLTMRMSWLNLGWFFAMGLVTEIVARIARPRIPALTTPSNYPGPAPVAGYPAQPAAPGVSYAAAFPAGQGPAPAHTPLGSNPGVPAQSFAGPAQQPAPQPQVHPQSPPAPQPQTYTQPPLPQAHPQSPPAQPPQTHAQPQQVHPQSPPAQPPAVPSPPHDHAPQEENATQIFPEQQPTQVFPTEGPSQASPNHTLAYPSQNSEDDTNND